MSHHGPSRTGEQRSGHECHLHDCRDARCGRRFWHFGDIEAYPAASILVTAVMLELNRQVLFRISLGLHLAIAAILGVAPGFAPQWPLFERLQFLSRVVGWRRVADVVRTKLSEERYGSILVDTREMAGELLYYLRDVPIPLYVWPSGPTPMDHYEMTRPFTAASPQPVLFVSLTGCPTKLAKSFGEFTRLGMQSVTLVKAKTRMLHFCRLTDYKARPALAPKGRSSESDRSSTPPRSWPSNP